MQRGNQKPRLPEAFAELQRTAQIMMDFYHPWCVCGGWAIDLFVNRISRQHKDVDFAIWRRDQSALRAYLTARGWTLEKVINGQRLPWTEGEFIELPVHTIHCRNPNAQPDRIEILFNEMNDHYFLFRRNQSIKRPLADAMLQLESGIRILAPEIVLLYKAKNSSDKERSDFEIALPFLDFERRAWLREALLTIHPGHEWLNQL
jgi:hypothetical protein